MRAYYLDTSAAIKLLRKEEETEALVQWHQNTSSDTHQFVSSDLLRTELMLSGARFGLGAGDMWPLLHSLTLLRVTSGLCDSAGRLSGMGLRSLDALHLASAMSLGDDLDGVITYDHRMLAAAENLGLHTISPA